MELAKDTPAIAVEQDDKGFFLYPRESSFVAGVYMEPIDGTTEYMVVFALKDGSMYAYYNDEFTLTNLMATLFGQETLSLGKWLNSYIKPIGKVFRVEAHDSEKGTRVSDRFAHLRHDPELATA
jgi:hypothetical protein